MIKKIVLLSTLFIGMVTHSYAQSPELEVFDNLVGSLWKAEHTWANGSVFRQEYEFEWSLNKTLVKVKTYGFIDEQQSSYGLRNEGIRSWDSSKNEGQFYEFDIFGGTTKGVMIIEGYNIYYDYEYDGAKLRDAWELVDNDTYSYTIGTFENGEWGAKYLETEIKRVK